MKKGIIVNLKRIKLLDYVTLNKLFIILCILFIFGVIIGAIFFPNEGNILNHVKSLLDRYITIHTTGNFIKQIIFSFVGYSGILCLYFISGTSMLGCVFTLFLMIWQGIICGGIGKYLYSTYGLTGIAFNAIILIPHLAIFTVCCFFAARHAIDYSILLAKLTFPHTKPSTLYIGFKCYCGKFLLFTGIAFLCTIIDFLLNLLFLKFFNF